MKTFLIFFDKETKETKTEKEFDTSGEALQYIINNGIPKDMYVVILDSKNLIFQYLKTKQEAIDYGLSINIPREQLDFEMEF